MKCTRICSLSRITNLPPLPPLQVVTDRLHSSSWTGLLSSYISALSSPVQPDPRTFPPLLKAISNSRSLRLGLTLHQHAVVLGYASDAHISSSLISFYARQDKMDTARRLFDAMPVKEVVPWSAIIGAYSQVGDVNTSFCMFDRMRLERVEPNSITALSLLYGISEANHLHCLHCWMVKFGLEVDTVVANSLLNVFLRCGELNIARRIFEEMPCHDIVSWNSMISGYSKGGDFRACVDLFNKMKSECFSLPDHQTLCSLASCAVNRLDDKVGLLRKQVHALIIRIGCEFDSQVITTLIVMYLKCGNAGYAYKLFQTARHKDVVLWTAMISGLIQIDRADEALLIFQRMLASGSSPTTTTITTSLTACAHLRSFQHGASIHGYITRHAIAVDRAAENSLITMYAKCGHLRQCMFIFDAMQDKDVVSWNAIVSAYAQNGHVHNALLLFNQMRLSGDMPDSITYTALLQASASLGILHYGKCLHNVLIRNQFGPVVSVSTSLIDMYSKCGDLKGALRCFNSMEEHDLVSWSAIIEAYGSHGMAVNALELYSKFLLTGMKPNAVMLLSLLAACSHTGLVLQGLELFHSIKEEYGLQPSVEHHACIVDLLGKAGRIKEALGIIKKLPGQPNADILGMLLDACRMHKNAILGEEVTKEIVALKPETAGSYLQLAHSFAALRRWDCVGETWRQMRALGLKKSPAWSFIELNRAVTTFFADHSSHPQYKDMILLLRSMDKEMRNSELEPDFNLYITYEINMKIAT